MQPTPAGAAIASQAPACRSAAGKSRRFDPAITMLEKAPRCTSRPSATRTRLIVSANDDPGGAMTRYQPEVES